MQPDQRSTLATLFAGSVDPWTCPRCGCRDWRTINTYFAKLDQSKHRRIACRNCHHVRMTHERPADAGGQ